MAQGLFVIKVFKGRNGLWRWNIRSRGNRRVIMDGAEGYATKANVIRAVYRAPLAWVDLDWDEKD